MTSNLYISAGIEGKGMSPQSVLAPGLEESIRADLTKDEKCGQIVLWKKKGSADNGTAF